MCSQPVQNQEETSFRDMIEKPRETLGLSKEAFDKARGVLFVRDFSSDMFKFLSNFLLSLFDPGYHEKLRHSPFLLCDVDFRASLEAESTGTATPTPQKRAEGVLTAALLPWGLLRPTTVDTWVRGCKYLVATSVITSHDTYTQHLECKGFPVPQNLRTSQVDKFARQGHVTFDLEIPLALDVGVTQQLLERVGGAENLLEGAKKAYTFLALHFADPSLSISKDLLCPTVHTMFEQVVTDYKKSEVRAKVHLDPNDLEAELLGIWTEMGEGETHDNDLSVEKILQFMNPTEDGRRVVAAVRFKSFERFKVVIPPHLQNNHWLHEIGQSSKRVQTHYWVFESTLKGDEELEWRVRCINMAFLPEEGLKVVDT